MTEKMPMVAIVGRPNVGKSSLLNALVGKRISIVQDMPGVTRDRISIPMHIDGRYVELVDTGGYGFVDPDQLTEHIKHQIEIAMARANLVLLVVDTQQGLTGADEQMATMLRRKGIKTVLVANKTDGPNSDPALGDFARLGFGTPIGVSAINNRNINALVDEIRLNVDLGNAPSEVPEPELMVAIVGKRNAGKSTLVNAIAELYEGEGDRVIVSEIPGTTRDSIDVRFEKEGKAMTVIDTAGVRKKRRMVTNDIEFYSFHRAQRSIRRADVVLMLINGDEHISEPDKKLAEYIAEQDKPVVLVVNKWDLVLKSAEKQAKERESEFDTELLIEEFGEYLTQELKHIDYAPVVFTTAKDGKNIQQVLDLAQHLFKQGNIRMGTGELNRVVKQILEERAPSSPSGRRVKLYYATQTDIAPPTIVLFVNHADFVTESYKRFMVNRFRELLPFDEVPIKLIIRSRVRGGPGGDEGMQEHKSPEGKPRTKPKPHPKKTAKRGAVRGTRPHR